MKIICNCGAESTFNPEEIKHRQFFQSQEKIIMGTIEGFSIDIVDPSRQMIELGCKKCGIFFQIIGRSNSI